jgi:hypothetical protein
MSANGPDRGYIDWSPGTAKTKAKLDAVLKALVDYEDHLPVTVRQLFYILVARLVIPKTPLEYRNLAYLLRKARRARIIPFESIHDQGSTLPGGLIGFEGAADLSESIRFTVEYFGVDRQLGQPKRVIVWCEAAGMLDQLERVGARYSVRAVAGGGFDSVTDKWQIVQLVRRAAVPFEVLHVGDLDRHGESIFEVLSQDVAAFDDHQGHVTFSRIAVTPEQVALYDLPTDPDDPGVVQAEALPPDILADIVEVAIRERLDLDQVAATKRRSAEIRAEFEAALRAAGLWSSP